MTEVCIWALSCLNVSSQCRERKGKIIRSKISSTHSKWEIVRMTTKSILISNEIANQTITPGYGLVICLCGGWWSKKYRILWPSVALNVLRHIFARHQYLVKSRKTILLQWLIYQTEWVQIYYKYACRCAHIRNSRLNEHRDHRSPFSEYQWFLLSLVFRLQDEWLIITNKRQGDPIWGSLCSEVLSFL